MKHRLPACIRPGSASPAKMCHPRNRHHLAGIRPPGRKYRLEAYSTMRRRVVAAGSWRRCQGVSKHHSGKSGIDNETIRRFQKTATAATSAAQSQDKSISKLDFREYRPESTLSPVS
jgi:hypothetical protein